MGERGRHGMEEEKLLITLQSAAAFKARNTEFLKLTSGSIKLSRK
jgi:hypothetical protein